MIDGHNKKVKHRFAECKVIREERQVRLQLNYTENFHDDLSFEIK